MRMSTKAETERIVLGLGEEVRIRRATPAEQTLHHLRSGDLVAEYHHTDRAPDVIPACGIAVEARRYGVRLPDRLREVR